LKENWNLKNSANGAASTQFTKKEKNNLLPLIRKKKLKIAKDILRVAERQEVC